MEKPAKPLSEVGRDETFPLYEDRCIRPDPFGLRHTFPAQAIGFKLTLSYREYFGADLGDPATESVMFLNEVGVDQFDIALDAAAWCRCLNFALHIDGGGFDPRWDSGDWSDLLTTNMLLRPGVQLNMDECVQPRKQIFLDENCLLSSDLFNATVRVSNTVMRMPATVEEDVRACDIHLQVREVMIVVSSALPRSLMNKAGDDGTIRFPHDPSDIAYALESAEDPANRQLGIMTSRAISTFRAQLTVRGFSIRISPIIALGYSQGTEQLLLPTEMTMIVCFEGVPPADESPGDQTKLAFLVSVIAHRFEMNIDFELIASAVGTVSIHVENLVKTVRTCADMFSGSYVDISESESTVLSVVDVSAPGEERIRKTLRGRKVLARKQIVRSRETGGLSFACCVHVVEIRTLVWRQHVSRSSPFRSLKNSSMEFVPLLCLLDFSIKEFDLGLDLTLHQQDRLLVLKLVIQDFGLSICDFGKVFECIDETIERKSDICHSHYMIELLSCKKTENLEPALQFRAQETLGSLCSRSVSTDLSNFTLFCQVDVVELTGILLLEALLMPTWKRPLGTTVSPSLFPPDSVGALFVTFMPSIPSLEGAVSLDIDDSIVISPGYHESVDTLLRTLFTSFLPSSVDVLLVRFAVNNVLLTLPYGTTWGKSIRIESAETFGLQLCASEFFVGMFASDEACKSEILNVFGRRQDKWSSFVFPVTKGCQHFIKSRQGLLLANPSQQENSLNSIIDAFDFFYSYRDFEVTFSISNDFSIYDTDRLKAFFVFLLLFQRRCKEIAENLAGSLKLTGRGCAGEKSKIAVEDDDSNPCSVACSATIASIQSARLWLRKANENWGRYDRSTRSVLSAKNKESAMLRRTLFAAERERLGAMALVDSQACGWLNFGAARRSGQRGVMTSTLYPHWAVLRRSLLFLYSCPGQV